MTGFETYVEHMNLEDEDKQTIIEYHEANREGQNLRRGFQTVDEIQFLIQKPDWENKEIRAYIIAVPEGAPMSKWETPLPVGGEYPSFGYEILYGWLNHGNLQGKMVEIYKKSQNYNPMNNHMIVTWLELDRYDLDEIATEVAMDMQQDSESLFWNRSYRMVNEDLTAMELAKKAVEKGYRIFYTCDTNLF
jgi:hypothetical protein